ncbi:MAG: 16S rRNA (guanine(527)-N(7))-methyltransferase RsmG [Novosphingobium sp.]
MIENEDQARAWIAALPEADSDALARLKKLAALLAEENTRQNLVSAASLDHVWQRHLADSAQLLRFVPRAESSPWLDLGTGAGFPGLVIAALRPECEVLMVESRARRISWLQAACDELGLTRARVLGSRLELVESREVCAISARAFAPLDRLVSLAVRFSTAQTHWLLPKGRSATQELEALRGWQHLFHVEQSLTDHEAGVIVGQLLGKKGRKSS